MARIHKVKEIANGWSDWIFPKMEGYRLACCDCGLVHNMDFSVVTPAPSKPGWLSIAKTHPKLRVMFRASRNTRSTAALRRGRSMQCPNCRHEKLKKCEPTPQSAGCESYRCCVCNVKFIVTNPSYITTKRP